MSEPLIQGSNRITADIVTRHLSVVGPGPLLSCLSLQYDCLLGQAGTFSATFPADDPRLTFLEIKSHYLDFYIDGRFVFYGLTESFTLDTNADGQTIMTISGSDSLRELDEGVLYYLSLVEFNTPTQHAPNMIIDHYNTPFPPEGSVLQWSFPLHPTESYVYGSVTAESALKALQRVATQTNSTFRLGAGRRKLEWLNPGDVLSSGVRAVSGAGDTLAAEENLHVCFIQNLSERRDAARLITAISPYGSGLGETKLDLLGTSRVAPAGYTYDIANNVIRSHAAYDWIGANIVRNVNFPDIRPLFNTDADVQFAKDYLFDTALAYLARNDSLDDVVEYDLDVIQLPAHVRVGMTLHVVYRRDNYLLDNNFHILGIRTRVDPHGGRSYSLTIAPINQWRFAESNASVEQMEQGDLFSAHPQIDAISYWENFRELIGENQLDHTADIPFVLSEEVVTIRQVLFRYKVERLLTGSALYTLDDETTLNAASVSGGSSATATLDSNTAATSDTATVKTGATAAGSTISGGGSTTGDAAAGSTVSGGSGTSGDTAAGSTISGGSGTSGDTAAGITIASGGTTTTDRALTLSSHSFPNTGNQTAAVDTGIPNNLLTNENYLTLATVTNTPTNWAVPASHYHVIGAHQHEHSHWHTLNNHVHSITNHTHTVPDHNHAAPAHTHTFTDGHSHSTPAHTHTITALHSHSTPAHTHTITDVHSHSTPAHTHQITATHDHTLSHTHPMAHTHNMPHDHNLPQHIHPLPPLVESFTVRRVPALNSYVMADLEYSVNGGAWLALDSGIPVAGGYYQVDITEAIQRPGGLLRPYQEDNLVQIRRSNAAGVGKSAQVRVKVGIRATIQSIVIYG